KLGDTAQKAFHILPTQLDDSAVAGRAQGRELRGRKGTPSELVARTYDPVLRFRRTGHKQVPVIASHRIRGTGRHFVKYSLVGKFFEHRRNDIPELRQLLEFHSNAP